MKTLTVIFALVTTVLAGCGTFNNIDKDHNKQCKENCNVIEGAAEPPTVIVQPTPVTVQPAQPVIVEKPVYIEKPVAESQTASINGYLNGRRHGMWVEHVDTGTAEGLYKNGRKHGHWAWRDANGNVLREGPFVDGKRHGHWVLRRANGDVFEGPFVNDKRQGHWAERSADGYVFEGPFVNDKRHGKWVSRSPDGSVKNLIYRKGERIK